jgi:hypothetical protein
MDISHNLFELFITGTVHLYLFARGEFLASRVGLGRMFNVFYEARYDLARLRITVRYA